MANYEISANLNINNIKAKNAINETIKEIGKLKKGYSDANKAINDNTKAQNNNNKSNSNATKSFDGLSKSINDNDKSYKSLFKTKEANTKQLHRLTVGLSDVDKRNSDLTKGIKKLHKELIDENASIDKAHKKWRLFAKDRGLVYNGMNLISSKQSTNYMTDFSNNLSKISKQTQTIGRVSQKALNDYNSKVAGLNTNLHRGIINQSLFNKEMNNVGKYMKRTYDIGVKPMDNGYSILTSKTNDAKQALSNYTKELQHANNLIRNGGFTPEARKRLATYRDTLGSVVMGQEKYNKLLSSAQTDKQGIKINVLKDIMSYMEKNTSQLGINQNAINGLNNAYKRFNTRINSVGGSLADISRGTGNYNKLLTTTTRSQRMQNYAMQVAGLRYNVLATSLGFVGGMLGTQLAMGFATARIEAVQFDQKAKQMFKTSKLNAKGIENVTKAIKEYTRENRKINTQGLEYTVAQVTKLNNLNEEQSKKIIPVVADISNMMRINGRSQEDSILAVNDALDGQFKRLQEIGVAGKKMLKAYGWNGNVDDKMSLIGALEKIGEKKGWSDLTKDVSTLDDAYNVLGNTIDDVLTPAVVNLTPAIVTMVQGISNLVSGLWDAPVAIKLFASSLGVLGVAFGKMKFEMLYAKLIGSEFIASLTGLDAGMYGITRSVGAVNVAVREGAISFEEGARCLMDYHTTQIGASRSFREYTTILNGLYTEQEALTIAQKTATGTEKQQIENALAKNKARTSELIYMRDLESNYAKYVLANNNLTASQKLQLSTIKNKANLTKTELGQIIAVNGLIDEETKTIDINTLAKKLNVDITKKSNMALASSSPILRKVKKDTDAKKRALLGLNGAGKENIILTAEEATANFEVTTSTITETNAKKLAKKVYKDLSKEQTKLISLGEVEAIVTDNLTEATTANALATIEQANANKMSYISLEDGHVLKNEEIFTNELLAKSEKDCAKAIEGKTFAQRLDNGSLKGWIKNVSKSAKEMIKSAGAVALTTAKFLLLTPEGWAVSAMLLALGVSAHKAFVDIKKLNNSYEKFYKVQEELPDKIEKLKGKLKELQETNKNNKNDKEIKDLKRKIDYYQKLYDKVNAVVEKRSELEDNTEIGVGQQNTRFYNRRRRKNNKPEEEYTDVDDAIKDIDKSNAKLEQLNDEQVKYQSNLDYAMDKNNVSYDKSMEYAEQSGEIFESLNQNIKDQSAEDWLTRIGGKWGEFFDRLELDWLNFKVNLPTFISDAVDYVEKNNPFTSIIDAFTDPVKNDLMGSLREWYDNFNLVNIMGDILKTGFDISGVKIDFSEIGKSVEEELTNLGKIFTDSINNFTKFFEDNDFSIAKIIMNAIMPEPVSAEGYEGTPLLEQIKQRLGLNDLGAWVTNEVEPKFKQLGDTVNYWLDINNWLQVTEDNGNLITDWWNTNIVEPFNNLLNQFGLDLHADGATVGRKLKQGIKEGIGKLVEPVSSKVQEIVTYLTSGQAVNDAKNKATDFAKGIYNGFKDGLGNPSKIVTDEVGEIVKGITDKIDEVKKKAQELGNAIPKGVTIGTDHHSPGLGARIVLAEMEYIHGFINDYIPKIYTASEKAGKAISDGINKNNVNGNLNIVQNNQDIMKSNNLASQNTVTQYGNMANTVDQSFTEMSDSATVDMQTVANQNAQYLAQMNADTSNNMTQMGNIHKSKLGAMQSSTVSATNSMTHAWNSMKNSIVNSASHIQSQSYQKFNSLHRSISSFYKQIQSAKFSAGGLVAGYPKRTVKFSNNKRTVNTGVAGYAGRSQDMAYTKLLKKLSNGSANVSDVNEFYNKYDIKCLTDDCYAGINPSTHVNKQLNYAHKWKIDDPRMYGIKLPMNNTVKDFDNGKQPRITYNNFEDYLGALLNARGFRGTYEFYFNSKRSNQQVWDDVRCNCYDGAELIMEIARDMGLGNVGMLHGDWKGIRHVCATVGGKVFDMTQFQNYGVFRGTPGVNFGGAGYTGRAVKWGHSGKFAGSPSNTTTNNRNNKVEIHINGNTFIGMDEYKKEMETIAEDVFYNKMSDNPCIGY